MLSMKTLRVAIVTMGSALLLGAGFAVATVQQLDGRGASATVPVMYAQELLTLAPGQALKSVPILSPQDHMAHKLAVSVNRRIEQNSSTYLRLALGGGMVFARDASGLAGAAGTTKWTYGAYPMEDDASIMCDEDNNAETDDAAHSVPAQDGQELAGTEVPTVHSSGGAVGEDYIVFRVDLAADGAIPLNYPGYVDTADPRTRGMNCDRPAARNLIWIDIFDMAMSYLSIPAGTGSYSASISLHSDPDEAQAGTNASSAVSGMATIVRAVNGLDVEVSAADAPAVAHVGTAPMPFLWFNTPTGLSNMAVLGSAKAQIGRMDLLNPSTGLAATSSDLIPDDSLTFAVEGDFSIGAFNLMATATAAEACPAPGSPSSPTEGNLAPDEDGSMYMAMLAGQDAGTYHLCVQVDVAGPGSNSMPIPAGNYIGSITQGTGALAKELDSGVIGRIVRNGASVKITYLTVAEKYNQRLIIVNDGANDASYDIGPFVTEEGTTATPQAMASGMVPAGGQVVIPVADIVSFSSADGRRHRAAATLSMNADVDDVQVATTQVNLEDGSTDTVVYATVDGAVVQ